MERTELKAIIENLLLASDKPVSADALAQTLLNGGDKDALRGALEELQQDFEGRPLQIIEVADGFQLCTRPEHAEWVRKFLKLDKTFRLSQPALDTLSIVAYKQPITRAEIDEIRGVDSSGVFRTLLEKKIVAPAGRKDVPGKPIMYRTTQKFLDYFGLKDLSELPTLDDFGEGEIEGEAGPEQVEIEFGLAVPPAESGEAETVEVEVAEAESPAGESPEEN